MQGLNELADALAARRRTRLTLAAVWLAFLAALVYRRFSPFLRPDDVWFLGEAESFYHGVAVRAGLDSMPLTGYLHSLFSHHLAAGWERLFLPLALLSLAGAAWSAGESLLRRRGAAAAALAMLVFIFMNGMVNWGRYFETAVFALVTALMAVFLLSYRETGRTRDAAMFGLLTGASLLCRSTFFLFPPFILAALWLARGEKKISAGAAAAVLVLPYAMLAPWWLMRHSLGLEFALFEPFRAKANIITGLLGYVRTIEGSYQEALALAGLDQSANLWRWGLAQAAAHPWLIAKAVLLRAWAVLAYKPLLTLLAAAALFFGRRDAGARLLWAFAAYFILVHLAMPVEPRYFVPLVIPLAALLAASLPSPLGSVPAGPAKAGAAAWLPAAALLAATAGLYARLPHYAAGARSPDRAAVIAREAAAHPGDPWLASMAGEADLEARHRRALELQDSGHYAEALATLEELLAARPGSAALWSDKGMQELRLGKKDKARASFRKAVELNPGFIPAYLNLLHVTPDKAAAQKLRAAALANIEPPYEGLRPLLSAK